MIKLQKRNAINTVRLTRQLQKFHWEISDLGLDNDFDGRIEQSMLEGSFKNLVLKFERNKNGEIAPKRGTARHTPHSFEWEVDFKTASLTIYSEHPLFHLKTKWKGRLIDSAQLQLFYKLKISGETLIVSMLLRKGRVKRRNRIKSFIERNVLPLFYL
jgi:hypothetical protein